MDSTRQQKYAKLIQKDMSDIFLRDAKGLFGNLFITITQE
jgi:ribosome-binding factor A